MSVHFNKQRPVVAIIGGGFSGAAVAYRLATAGVAQVVIFEPRDEIGRGLAYAEGDPVFRINVPATKMSLLPEDPLHFQRWIETTDAVADDPQARAADGNLYPRRPVFGAYVAAHLAPLLARGDVRHIRDRAARVRRIGDAWAVDGESGESVLAQAVVASASHPPPSIPSSLRAIEQHPRFCGDIFGLNALRAVNRDERILIVGSGLTAVDAIAALDRLGHKGPIILISRRGQKPQPQARAESEAFGDFIQNPPRTARALIARIRTTLALARNSGSEWQSVIDAVRKQGGTIWANLPLTERRRLARHARPYWDAHRFRASPQVYDVLQKGLKSGAVRFVKASLAKVDESGDGIEVDLRQAGKTCQRVVFDRIILATGPSHKDILRQPWLAGLHQQGLVAMDPTLLGLSVSRRCEALDAKGEVVSGLFIAGPLARATFGELMGLPEVSAHAALVAGELDLFLRECAPRASDLALRS